MFTISDTGLITLVKTLDYEQTTNYLVAVLAYDKTNDVSSETVPVNINVINRNDNQPIIGQLLYYASVLENISSETEILRISATDADIKDSSTPDYQTIQFRIISRNDSGIFNVSSNGAVTLLSGAQLDYEQVRSYQIVVGAVNLDGLWSTNNSTLSIQIRNVNEFAPSFSLTDYYWYVHENAAPVSYTAINAEDGDRGLIQYSIQGPSQVSLSFDTITAVVTLNNGLDYELEQDYLFKIKASDGQFDSIANLHLIVQNINDNAPTFRGEDIVNTQV